MSVADDKLNVPRTPSRVVARISGGLLAGLRAQHPRFAAIVIHAAKVAAWIAFYLAIRALVG